MPTPTRLNKLAPGDCDFKMNWLAGNFLACDLSIHMELLPNTQPPVATIHEIEGSVCLRLSECGVATSQRSPQIHHVSLLMRHIAGFLTIYDAPVIFPP